MQLRTQDGPWSDEADEFGIECVLADGFRHDSACESGCPDDHLLDRYVILARERGHFVQAALVTADPARFTVEYRAGGGTPMVLHRITEPIGYHQVRELLEAYLHEAPDWNARYAWEPV
ncbi:hypothetical protein [Phytomonospora endophytica]|uniref:Uncharacterized protein n=1 Tax=Phytomonospora endophytica TaxID=714109 RepID=A0A841FBK2_9ACTN|nr:hypothetical protein [Phytomonospora endophytica]MBB6033164.1 hypothetical protein [Phytomonospora endophytica]GIG65389.1 hypothetical protein Pen01_16840 [Phytomonospora endophytica]